MNWLAVGARQTIAVGEPLAVDSERVLGPGYPDTLTSRNKPRQRPQGGERAGLNRVQRGA